MLKNIGSGELIIIAIVVLLLFGTKKLNELARGLGESTKELKKVKAEFNKAASDDLSDLKPKTDENVKNS
jgi:sec-independent protein translocase protein TatA